MHSSTIGQAPRGSLVALDALAVFAETCVRAHIGTPLSVAALRTMVGCSSRRLRDAFYRHRGVAPQQYILRERLEAARCALRSGAHRPRSVTDVAIAYGFTELGRFAVRYRRAFGERPSDTLRRARRVSH